MNIKFKRLARKNRHHCVKKKYSRREAHRAVNRLHAIQEKRVHIYHCDFCRSWHVGGVPVIDEIQSTAMQPSQTFIARKS